MKVLVLNGSPKGEKSNTLQITKAFLKGFPEETKQTWMHLYRMQIRPCIGCFSCWSGTPGVCCIRDDMQQIIAAIREADVIVESFPLYFFGMPSQLKAMTDRCLPFTLPYMGNQADGGKSFHEFRDPAMHQKKLVVISTCGYVDADIMYPALRKQLDLICGTGHYTMIACPEGELFIAEKAARQRKAYLRDITAAGEEFSQNLCLSAETQKRIAMPILSPAGFEAITKAHWQMRGV